MSDKSALVLHQFATVMIFQTTEDITLKDGRIIPKGYVNATQMCKANNKEFKKWFSLKSTTEYMQELQGEVENIPPVNTYVIRVDGADYDIQGTWTHYEVALVLAQWLSPKFAVWAARTLRHVIEGNFKALTPDAEKAQRNLQEIWVKLRLTTKESFWFIADTVKQYYFDHPRQEHYPGQNYSEVFDAINVGLFGVKAKTIKAELGITSGLTRDHFGTDALKKIDLIQRIADASIKHRHLNPIEAVEQAIAMMSYPISSFKD